IYDEPFADSSQIPTHLVAALTRRHVTVALSGDGGDELFLGYGRYAWVRRLWRLRRGLPAPARRGLAGMLLARPAEGWDCLTRRVPPALARRLPAARTGERLHKLAGLLETDDPLEIFLGAMTHWRERLVPGVTAVGSRLSDPGERPDLPDLLDQMAYLDLVTYLPDDILAKVDRATMAVSLESRIPLLDPDVVELASRIPASVKRRGGTAKWPLRQVLERYVPPELFDRPKMGFAVPVGAWLRGPLRDWAETLLAERRLRDEGYLDPAPVRRAWSDHLEGRGTTHHLLWDVLMFQSWLETPSH
ncbi:MAG: asparagine synthetase B family protein, partial [Acidimicrobiia bacterium]